MHLSFKGADIIDEAKQILLRLQQNILRSKIRSDSRNLMSQKIDALSTNDLETFQNAPQKGLKRLNKRKYLQKEHVYETYQSFIFYKPLIIVSNSVAN